MATDRVTADGRTRLLADGTELPMLGLGVWQVPNGPECVNAVRWALELAYVEVRHPDRAGVPELARPLHPRPRPGRPTLRPMDDVEVDGVDAESVEATSNFRLWVAAPGVEFGRDEDVLAR